MSTRGYYQPKELRRLLTSTSRFTGLRDNSRSRNQPQPPRRASWAETPRLTFPPRKPYEGPLTNLKFIPNNQKVVEWAPRPARNSRGGLFGTIFARIFASEWRWMGLAIFLLMLWGVPAQAEENPPYVVILNSYHQGYEWSDKVQAGLLDRLRQDFPGMEPAIEYLDAKRFPGEDQRARLSIYLAEKYQGRKIDVVVVLDNSALELALQYRQKIWPDVPLVFAGINDFKPAMLEGQDRVTGVAEVHDMRGTLDLALSLHPDTEEVLVIHDYTVSGLALRREMEAILPAFEGRVKIRFTPPNTFKEVQDQQKSLPENSLALLLSFTTDRRGRSLSVEEGTRLLSDSPAPMYALTEARLGYGIVGGVLLGGWEHGRRAGEMAVRVLGGEDPARIPVVTESTAKPMFNYKQLTRFDIPLEALPKGSVIINRPATFYAQNKRLIWWTSAIILAMSLVIFGLTMHILYRRRTEKALLESEESLRQVLEVLPVGVWVADENGVIVQANPAGQKIWAGAEYVGVEQYGLYKGWWRETGKSIKGEDWAMARAIRRGETSLNEVIEIECFDGTRKTILNSALPLKNLRGEVVRAIVVNQDITEHIQFEEKLKTSLREKEVLLKEIHHRVKNNLQIIATLLSLQLRYDRTQNPAEMFQDCQNRIRSMALIHESLYSSENLANINFRQYLEKLTSRLLTAYGSSAQNIKIRVTGNDVFLDISQAVPCGLIVNELVVNSLKHAFQGKQKGEIQVIIEATADQRILEVRDDGLGLGPDFDQKNPSTFGWMMVKNLAKQLGGDIRVESVDGTTCRIAF